VGSCWVLLLFNRMAMRGARESRSAMNYGFGREGYMFFDWNYKSWVGFWR